MRKARSLPIAQWPAADRLEWEGACAPGQRLKRGGRASHLKPITRNDLARRYGYFLDHLARTGRLDRDAPAGSQVTHDTIDTFLAELRERVGSVTQYGTIFKVRRTAELLNPAIDLKWLREIEADLAFLMQPRSKHDRLVHTQVLVDAGMSLMIEADTALHLSALRRARQYRDGLMLALLALVPIRLKNFASLEIGATFRSAGRDWWIVLDDTHTKEARPDERRAPSQLIPSIEKYIATHRPALTRSHAPTPAALWLSSNDGQPMTYSAVENAIYRVTQSTVGIRINPHMFRTAGNSTAAVYAPDQPNLGSALLNHHDQQTTREHYNRASTQSAQARWRDVLQSYSSE